MSIFASAAVYKKECITMSIYNFEGYTSDMLTKTKNKSNKNSIKKN